MSCRMHYRREYRDGLVAEGETEDYHTSAREALDHHVALLKDRGVTYTVDGLTLTYDDMHGKFEDLWSTWTLTWTDRATEEV